METNTRNFLRYDTHEHLARRGQEKYGSGCGGKNYRSCGSSNYGAGHQHYGAGHEHFGNCSENHASRMGSCGNNRNFENNSNKDPEAYDSHPNTYSSCHDN